MCSSTSAMAAILAYPTVVVQAFRLRNASASLKLRRIRRSRGGGQACYDQRVIPAIVLAAGKSTRMGRSKALLPLDADETFLTRIIATLRAADVEDVVVVVGHDAR